MDERIHQVATLANLTTYDSKKSGEYVDGAPHIKHASLRELYGKLVVQIFDEAKNHKYEPRVLDLGAGEGSVTLPFLELGARVVAVDISQRQLDTLQQKCIAFGDKLEIRCQDIHDVLKDQSQEYDIIVANSFLHHVPDYIGMIQEAIHILSSNGQFFSFQDPLRYDSVNKGSRLFSEFSYFSWRVLKGDVVAGLKRRLRRTRGIYYEGTKDDSAEYHVIRNGVDQQAIYQLFHEKDFYCEIIPYFSTQSSLFQPVGAFFNITNTFAVIARKNE